MRREFGGAQHTAAAGAFHARQSCFEVLVQADHRASR
jgi:hypothetical protein